MTCFKGQISKLAKLMARPSSFLSVVIPTLKVAGALPVLLKPRPTRSGPCSVLFNLAALPSVPLAVPL